jgi:hypothetical protein
VQGDLAWIECAYSAGSEGAAGAKPGNQSGAGVVDQVGTPEAAHKRSVVGPIPEGSAAQRFASSGKEVQLTCVLSGELL